MICESIILTILIKTIPYSNQWKSQGKTYKVYINQAEYDKVLIISNDKYKVTYPFYCYTKDKYENK